MDNTCNTHNNIQQLFIYRTAYRKIVTITLASGAKFSTFWTETTNTVRCWYWTLNVFIYLLFTLLLWLFSLSSDYEHTTISIQLYTFFFVGTVIIQSADNITIITTTEHGQNVYVFIYDKKKEVSVFFSLKTHENWSDRDEQ